MTYDEFKRSGIDLSPLGFMRGGEDGGYICDPVGARAIGWCGVDGIHFSTVSGCDVVFAISPMNFYDHDVQPVAKDFDEFLSLLLTCRDTAAIEQAWLMDADAFADFVNGVEVTDDVKAALDALRRAGVVEMSVADAYAILRERAGSFNVKWLEFPPEYYENMPDPAPVWSIDYDGDADGGETRIDRSFEWRGESWRVLAYHDFKKGLIVDILRAPDPEMLAAYQYKYGDPDSLTGEARERAEEENPFSSAPRAELTVNGETLHQSRMSCIYHVPEMNGADLYAVAAKEHYGIGEETFVIYRAAFNSKRGRGGRKVSSMSLTLTAERRIITLSTFSPARAGENVKFTTLDGAEHTLTAASLRDSVLDVPSMSGYEFPTRAVEMEYEITPPAENVIVADANAGDSPKYDAGKGELAVIGGADGPTSFIFARKQAKSGAVTSKPRFARARVIWAIREREPQTQPATVEIV